MSRVQATIKDRAAKRESICMLCDLGRADGTFAAQARLRNISANGMMADAAASFVVGETIIVAFRNAASVYATINWVKRGQIGATFHTPIDPHALRRPLAPLTGAAASLDVVTFTP